MSTFQDIENVYFIGIGGIGMSALARYFVANGKMVAGYDRTSSPITNKLQEEGVILQFGEEIAQLPIIFLETKKTLVVYTPAVAVENKLFRYFTDGGFKIKKRAEVLGVITRSAPTLAIAGTHGKTTTTAILAHLLKANEVKLTAFLGGISENYESNIILDGNEVVVVEADEFDRSFLQLSPTMAAITSMDADHLDIYGENEQLQQSFRDFAQLLPEDGSLFFKNGLPLKNGKTIGINDDADFSAVNSKIDKGWYEFELRTPTEITAGFKFCLPGAHNLMNAVTALAMAITYGLPAEKLKTALATFKGVQRRFSYRIKTDDFVLIDDYAHHPAEINAVHQAVREMYPKQKVLAVFQPHLYSRTRDFADDFAGSLSQFDAVLLLDIYPAREQPIAGIDAEMLLGKIKNEHKKLTVKANLFTEIKNSKCPVVVMMGAGDIGEEIAPLKMRLQHEN